ncbi:Phosphoribosylglycinamide formyltransferase [Lachnellula suecica]|uniref:Phosphoribosylglycinamide formyltransferase n=1 Tax=Lachnellula suecica TaxID=602035 RepID=A0A8T9CBB2_9HELO|nr:Phosphoribosylglycinamide formyltransferase [Lachnellula suecica]
MPKDPPPTKATVLISGTGTNLQALIDAAPLMPYLRIVRVISNKKGVEGLKRAERAKIPTAVHNLVTGKYIASGEKDPAVRAAGREKYDADLAKLVLADEPDIVVCAGFLHILSQQFLDPLAERKLPVTNLHPALPTKYDGINAIKRAYDDYHKGKLENDTTGIMIHYVISEVDRGQPIVVREIQCKTPETLDELTSRIHEHEHELIVEGTQMAVHNLWEERAKSG